MKTYNDAISENTIPRKTQVLAVQSLKATGMLLILYKNKGSYAEQDQKVRHEECALDGSCSTVLGLMTIPVFLTV